MRYSVIIDAVIISLYDNNISLLAAVSRVCLFIFDSVDFLLFTVCSFVRQAVYCAPVTWNNDNSLLWLNKERKKDIDTVCNDVNTLFTLGKLSNRKSNETWELVQIGGGSSKNQKSPKFQLGIVQN